MFLDLIYMTSLRPSSLLPFSGTSFWPPQSTSPCATTRPSAEAPIEKPPLPYWPSQVAAKPAIDVRNARPGGSSAAAP